MDLYSPEYAVLHSILGRKVFSKYSVQVRMKSDYINKVISSFIVFGKLVVRLNVTSIHFAKNEEQLDFVSWFLHGSTDIIEHL